MRTHSYGFTVSISLLCISALACSWFKPSPADIAKKNEPATVMILTEMSGRITVPMPEPVPETVADLQRAVRQQAMAGADKGAVIEAMFREMFAHFDRYFVPGPPTDYNVQMTMVGTGFFVSKEGYLLTNAHVIGEQTDYVRTLLIQQGLSNYVEGDLRATEQIYGITFSDELKQLARQADYAFFMQHATFGDLARSVNVVRQGLMTLDGNAAQIPAQVVSTGKPDQGRDVALLKINAGTDFPMVSLAKKENLNAGDPVFVIGFPDVATFHQGIDPKARYVPTFTSGIISARKTQGGLNVYQMDAQISHGNSGGPVFNDRGDVVGITTFGSIDTETGKLVQGFNFLVPIDAAREYLRAANLAD
jgi:serine protease Do